MNELKALYGCIYRVRNIINNKCYIGQTVNKKKRFSSHLSGRTVPKLSNAIKHYGKESFRCEVIYDKVPTWMLSDLEERTIKKYDSVDNGYNLSLGDGTFDYWLDHSTFRMDVYKHKEDIIRMYRSGKSLRIIAKKYNCTNETIRLILERSGERIRTNAESARKFVSGSNHPAYRHDVHENSEKIIQKYKSGRSLRSICEEYNCNREPIQNILASAGINEENRYGQTDFFDLLVNRFKERK